MPQTLRHTRPCCQPASCQTRKTAVDQRRNQFLEKERVSFGLLGQYRP
jgi:hypothetical protein